MDGFLGLVVLVLLVVALVRISRLDSRVRTLERRLDVARTQEADAEPTLGDWMRARSAPDAGAMPPAAPVAPRGAVDSTPPPAASRPPVFGPPPTPVFDAGSSTAASAVSAAAPRPMARPARPDPFALAARAVRRWFTEGNVPVKVGMLVLFAGVAALLKYASDQGWMRVPVEFRLAGIALASMGALVFAWRQRLARRSFALALQGGAIGVLLLVVFAAFKLYGLIPAGAAFALSVVLVAGVGVLAVAQEALALAVLGILAGFLAPVWLSTGQGSHVALFGYYAVLNAGIFAIAWMRPWRMLNALGFAFTFGIGTAWGVLRYRPDHFGSTEPFLLLFFAFYLLIPILYARRRASGRRDFVDGCLLFGTPLVAFSLQAALLEGARMPLAFCALGLATVYLALALLLRRREHYAPLVAPYAVLAVGFATLAVPLALSARATASIFALEGAASVWLGLRQQRRLPQSGGALLQLGAAVAFVVGMDAAAFAGPAIANAAFMSALLIALGGFASAWSWRRAGHDGLALVAYLWALAWWLGNGITEIVDHVPAAHGVDALMLFVLATAALAVPAQRRLPSPALAWTMAAGLAAALPLAIWQADRHAQPFAGWGLPAWLAFAAIGWQALRRLDRDDERALPWAHAAWVLAWSLAASLGLHRVAEAAALGEGWRLALTGLPWLLAAALVQWRPRGAGWPVVDAFARWRAPLQALLAGGLGVGATLVLWSDASPAPLAWLPLLNPLELLQLGVLALWAGWLASTLAPAELRARRLPILAAAGFVLASVATLRTAHHWGGVPWDTGLLRSNLVQTSLTVVWSLLGVLGWIVGSRRGQRELWLAGAVLMAVVLAKLLLVDRQHLGNLLGIVSFMAYGVLCTAVGYFAPAPPRPLARDPQPEGGLS